MRAERLILWPVLALLALPVALALYDFAFGASTSFVTRLWLWNQPWHIAGLIALLAYVIQSRGRMPLPMLDVALLFALIGLSLWQIFAGVANPELASLLLVRLVLTVALGMAAYSGVRLLGARFSNAVYAFLLGGAVLVSAILWLVILQDHNNSSMVWPWNLPGYGALRLYGYALEAAIGVGIGLLSLNPHGKPHRLKLGAMLVFLWVMLFWTGGRGGVMAIFAALAFASLLMPRRALALLGIGLVSAALGAGLSLLAWHPALDSFGLMEMISKSENPEGYNQSGSRSIRWRAALELIKERPVFGYGLEQFSQLWPHFVERDITAGFTPPFYFLTYRNVHNMPLEVLLAWGFSGGAVFAVLLLRGWGKAVLRVRATPARLPALLGLNVLLAHSLLSGTYNFAHSLFTMAILLGICLAPNTAQNENTNG